MRTELTKEDLLKIMDNSVQMDFEMDKTNLTRFSLLFNKVGIHFTKVSKIGYDIDNDGNIIYNQDKSIDDDFLAFEDYYLSKNLFKEVYEEYRMEQFKKLIN
jgi:hypothetical protein